MPLKSKKFEYKKASITKRTIAYIIDSSIMSFIITLPFRNYLKNINKNISFSNFYNFNLSIDLLIIGFTVGFLMLAYFTILEFYTKQTIGKIIMQIKVISLNKDFKFYQVIIRNISKVIDILLLVDIIYMLISQEKERLFGRLSKTQVVLK